MIIDFSKIEKEPLLILKNIDGTPIATLGFAFNIRLNAKYNEVSDLSFDIPAFSNGVKTPQYDKIVGMKIIELHNVGQFILTNPQIKMNGVSEIKSCTAYSLEYELTYKNLSIPKSTYNLWNPVAPDNTIIDIILKKIPNWHIGSIDESLYNKYRTFEIANENLFNIIKSTLQDSFQCIFTFDTLTRTINVRDVSSSAEIEPIYISLNNLIKNIDITENSDDIITVVDVNGAEGVDIRSLNPCGNKLYNIDYFLNDLPQTLADKWLAWKTSLETNQTIYYNLVIQRSLQTSRLLTEKAALTTLENEKTGYEALQSVYISGLASGDTSFQQLLTDINAQIASKNIEIINQKNLLVIIQNEIDAITANLQTISNGLAFSNYFTVEENLILDKYFKESSLTNSSFVINSVSSYNDNGLGQSLSNITFNIEEAEIQAITTVSDKVIYSIKGGIIVSSGGTLNLNCHINKMSLERTISTGKFVLSIYTSSGTIYTNTITASSISSTGTCVNITSSSTSLSFTASTCYLFFTEQSTDYEKYSVEWDLYEYAKNVLSKISTPSYTFKIDSANFLSIAEYENFKNSLTLGNKIYLDIGTGTILNPFVIGVDINFEDPSDFALSFSSKYSSNDSAFALVDLLEQSVSISRSTDVSKFTYSSFVDSGASTKVQEYITNSLDLAKQAILSSNGIAPTLDNSGLHIRKLNQAGTGYEPEEIKIVENSIVFSNDNFATAKMAIGKFVDANLGITWGIVAPNIVGTILAGSNLVIESAKQSGGTSVFKVDANGATLYNSTFTVTDGVTKVGINGTSGFAIGDMNLYSDANFTIDPTHAYLYIDTNGKLVTKSIIQASDYLDSSGNSMLDVLGRFKSDFLNLGNITLDTVTGDITTSGDVTLGGNINITGNITWSESNSPVQVQYSVDGVTSWHTTYASTDYFARYSYDGGVTWTSAVRIQGTDGSDANVPAWVSSMQSTYIDGQWVISPNIYGGTITSGSTIDVTTDLRVGNNVYIGNSLDLSTEKMLRFTNSANITALNDNLTISCDYLFLSPSVVDFSGAGSIYWGTNAPVARFG